MKRRRSKADYNRYYRYGITPEQFDDMGENQCGRCLICGKEISLVVDHNHTTKRVRALLCRECNTGLGKFKDDPKLVRRAAAYLQAFGSDHPDPHGLLIELRRMGAF